MQQLAEDIWIVEGDNVSFMSLPYNTRMTVIRLNTDELWLHSPIKITDKLVRQLNRLGKVNYLIAPNHLHHLFLPDWQTEYPNAKSYGTQQVIQKRQDISFDVQLDNTHQLCFSKDIAHELFCGSNSMQESVFFHRPSKILILTDLIENFSPEHFSTWQGWLARLAGIVAPNGKTPLDWRLTFMFGKKTARKSFNKILTWQPEKIVMAHGEIVHDNAIAFLEKSFQWLK